RGPQELVLQMPIDELVQIEQVLKQLPALRERWRHELDQRFGKIRRDVLVRERGAELARMRRLRKLPARRHAQGFLLHALAPALQNLRLATVDEGREAPLEDAIHSCARHGPYQRTRPVSTSRSIVKSPRRL